MKEGSPRGCWSSILLCCAVIILTDAALLFWFLGPFIGAAILVAAGIALLVGFFRLSTETKQAG
jgi:hypothetical protein|tara:strand:- start:224 stop:415 length:192 start_codon:yes stop_codon:yes gene_type:complete